MKEILKFLEETQNKRKAWFVGTITAISGLFLNISVPINPDARHGLEYVQMFWLALLTLSLTSLFFDFTKFVWSEERKLNKKYDIGTTQIITVFMGILLGMVIFNLWRYLLLTYSGAFANFLVVLGFPGFIVLGSIWVGVIIERNRERIPLIVPMVVDSIIVGALSGIAGLYIGEAITRNFYPFWILTVAPFVGVGFFLLLSILCAIRKRNPFRV